MGTFWNVAAGLTGLTLLAAVTAAAQTQTVSAKPGAINYIEGTVAVNGKTVAINDIRAKFLGANDRLSTEKGKAELLLTPGVFLRVGSDSEIQMVSPSLTETQVELTRGEAMLEASGLVKDSNLQVIDHGSVTTIKKNGLYRFTADVPPTVAVFDGKAEVSLDDRIVKLKKGRQTVLAAGATAQKFDRDQLKIGDLYAWSNVRSEYEAAASYRLSRSASLGLLPGMGYGPGFGAFGSGWYLDSGLSSWTWLPGSGAVYSPFGYGFYSPGAFGYPGVIGAPIYGGRPWSGRRWNNGGGVRPPVSNPPNGGNPPAHQWNNGNAPGAGGGGGAWHHSPGMGGGNWHGGGGMPSPGGNPGGAGPRPSFGGGAPSPGGGTRMGGLGPARPRGN